MKTTLMKTTHTLSGVLILLGGWAAGSAAASEDNTVWSATMTVGEASFGPSEFQVFQGYFDVRVPDAPSPFGVLSDISFEYGGTTYTIQAILDNTPDTIVSFAVHPVLPETVPLVFEADGYGVLQFGNVTWYDIYGTEIGNVSQYSWNDLAGQDWDWIEGDVVHLRLAEAQTAPKPVPAATVQSLVADAVTAHGGLQAGGASLTIDASQFFTYGSGASAASYRSVAPAGVTFSATSNPASVAAVQVNGSELTIEPTSAGDANIKVTATDGNIPAEVAFDITVATAVPVLPLAGVLALGALLYGLARRRLAGTP